jgi:hypothetical protein
MISSRLSSLLVRDGVLGVKRMEQAFQRQVIYGGGLDTILLEMNAVPEERLWHYLSLATGLPAADRDLLEYFDPRAVQVCPREVAEQYHVAPCALDGPALRVLVIDPVDLGELEALATALGVPVQPFVVPEFRFHAHLERLFGIPTPSRYTLLLRRHVYVPGPVRRGEPSVVVRDDEPEITRVAGDDEPRDTEPMDVPAIPESGPAIPGTRRTVEMSTDALMQQVALEEARRKSATEPHMATAPTAPLGTPAPAPPEKRITQPRVASATPIAPDAEGPGRQARAVRGTIQTPVGNGNERTREPSQKVIAEPPRQSDARMPTPASGVVQAPWRGGGTLEPRAIAPRDAMGALGRAEDRDTVFGLLVRAARARCRYAALLTVQGATAFGRVGIDGDVLDPDVTQVAIPLASAHALRGAYDSRSPYIGPVATGIPEIDQMLAMLGGVVPPVALILPIVIRERTVALVYAHRGADVLASSDVADVLPVAGEAALALGRLIVKSKGTQGYARATTAETVGAVQGSPPPPAEDIPQKPRTPSKDSWQRPVPRPTPPAVIDFAQLPGAGAAPMPRLSAPTPVASSPAPTVGINVLVDVVEQGTEPGSSRAGDEALVRPDELLAELNKRFPGRLDIDRYATSGRALRAAQHGPLLALCIRLGVRVIPMLVDKLSSADREVRYYATLCLAEVRAPIAVPGLVGRLFDPDYGVRGAALEALLGYPPRDVDSALQPVRLALRSDALRARAAAHALGELRDVKSLLDLIDATERDSATATEAHRALVLITKQDFGTKAKKWRKWFEDNRGRSRIEWMLDGLAHSEPLVRLSAADELKRLTGEYFGYHHDAPKREREEARGRWLKWWEEIGRKRFVREGTTPPVAR